MRRNCNLELQLLPTSSPALFSNSRSSSCYTSSASSTQQPMGSSNANVVEEKEEERQQHQMTIFCSGKVCVCDVTVIQAREIIWKAATKETDERNSNSSSTTITLSDQHKHPTCLSASGFSMKRSLQHFLQSRRHRVQAAAPYRRRC